MGHPCKCLNRKQYVEDNTMDINSSNFFRSHWAVWKVFGITPRQMNWPKLYIGYCVVLHLLTTICYPLHLGLSVFRNADLTEDIFNLTIFATCLTCSLKFILYVNSIHKVHRMEELLGLLDSRVDGTAQRVIYNRLRTQLRTIMYAFIGIYLAAGTFAEVAFLFKKERRLMYPAWLPFDWANSTRNFYIANVYQVFGIGFQLLQNYANDSLPGVLLCLISAHIQMLYVRFEQVGQDDAEDAEDQLEACITDHKNLLELLQTVESLISLPMLIQFAVSGLNMCITTAAVLFFVTEPMSQAYFFFYALGVPLQIFPACYYGTDMELWFGKLHYAAFSCNWPAQSRSFKRKMMLFVERSLKHSTALAGGLVPIHVNTFFATLKFGYSLFTILIGMRSISCADQMLRKVFIHNHKLKSRQ